MGRFIPDGILRREIPFRKADNQRSPLRQIRARQRVAPVAAPPATVPHRPSECDAELSASLICRSAPPPSPCPQAWPLAERRHEFCSFRQPAPRGRLAIPIAPAIVAAAVEGALP